MKKITYTFLIAFLFGLTSMLGQTYTTGIINFNANYTAQVDVTSTLVTLTLNGPDDRWLGMGFGINCMIAGNDVVMYDGTDLTDRNFLGVGQVPATDSQQDWSIMSNTTNSGTRTIIATRARDTGDTNDFVFPEAEGPIDFVWSHRATAGFVIPGNSHGGNNGSVTSNFTLNTLDFNTLDFSISPNPANVRFNITLPTNVQSAKVQVIDILGKSILQRDISDVNASINVSNWNTGIYIVRVSSGNASQSKRFVKQ